MSAELKPVPNNKQTITPYLTVKAPDSAIAFYRSALGAVEVFRMEAPGTGELMHAELKIGDATIYLSGEWPDFGILGPLGIGGTPVTIHLNVGDVDAVHDQAVAAGATSLMAPSNQFWGDRFAKFQDPEGHRWSIATQIEQLTPEQMQERMLESFAEPATDK